MGVPERDASTLARTESIGAGDHTNAVVKKERERIYIFWIQE